MRTALLALALALAAVASHAAEALYGASVRSIVGAEAPIAAGNLYAIDAASANFRLIAGVRTAIDGAPLGITGLADHPRTGDVYGITAENSPSYPGSLVRIDLATATATVIGPLGAPGTDIAFDRDGKLFVWLRETGQLGSVDLASGRATPIGMPGSATETGGLATDSSGRMFLAATGAAGTLDTIDAATGSITRGARLSAAPFAGINSLAFSPSGKLLAVNTNLGTPARTALVTIDTRSGAVTEIGALPNDTDALLYAEPPWSVAGLLPSGAVVSFALAALVLAVALGWVIRTSRRGA